MVIGEVVHKAIELHWDNMHLAREYVALELTNRMLVDKESIGFADNCLANYFQTFKPFLADGDKIEIKFKIPFTPGVFIVGKIDRISNGNVFDWKTARSPATTISHSIQFILYNWAYKKLYNAEPSGVYYAALTTGKLIKFSYDAKAENILLAGLIPSAIRDIKSGNYLRNGVFRKACYRCSYSETCLLYGGGDGVDSPVTSEE
jgi:hypothetical protein